MEKFGLYALRSVSRKVDPAQTLGSFYQASSQAPHTCCPYIRKGVQYKKAEVPKEKQG